MFSSLAFLNAACSFPCCFADSAERSLSIKTDEEGELFISFFLFSQAQSLSRAILETKRTKIGRGRGGRDAPSLDSVRTPLLKALFKEPEVSGFPVRCIAWNLVFFRIGAKFRQYIHHFVRTLHTEIFSPRVIFQFNQTIF